jgi:hypothetical protein
MRWIAAKTLELLGTGVLVFSLLNGLGLTASGDTNLGKEIFLLFAGTALLVAGATLDLHRATGNMPASSPSANIPK